MQHGSSWAVGPLVVSSSLFWKGVEKKPIRFPESNGWPQHNTPHKNAQYSEGVMTQTDIFLDQWKVLNGIDFKKYY